MRPPHNFSSLGAESNYSRPRQIVHCPLSIQISASANSMASKGFRSSTPKQTSFVWGPILFKSSGGMNPPCGKVLPSAKRLDGASAGPPAAAEGVDDLLFNIFC